MRFHVLATDYDGTIAHHGVVDDDTIAALERARKSGRKLILVSGRELPDLQKVFSRFDLFDLAVLENGAIIYNPATKEVRVLAEPPPAAFIHELQARGVAPISTGHVIVATWEPHQATVLHTIREHGLELQVIFNKGAVMVLPSGVNKATGLVAALNELGLSIHNVVGVGDAENDHAFMRVCECSAAVANAVPAVKGTADIVLAKDHGAGVAELIDHLLAADLADLKTLARHRIPIGAEGEGQSEVGIDPAGPAVLVCGTSGSGKSTLTTSILEHLSDVGYQSLVVDPEGDYTNLEFAAHAGNPAQAPRPQDVADALKDPRRSLVVNLLGVALADRPKFFAQLLPRILEVKAHTGRPHWLVIDEAHHLLPAELDANTVVPLLPDSGVLFVTVHPERVNPAALRHVGKVLLIGGHPTRTIRDFCKVIAEAAPRCPAVDGDKLPSGDAMFWRRGDTQAVVIHTRPTRTERKRHLRKYAEGNVGPERSFYFRGPDGKLNLKASNLFQFLQLGDGVDDDTWEFHRKAGDYSRWVRVQIKDDLLAEELAAIEQQCGRTPAQTRAAMRAAVEARYTLPADDASGEVG